MNPALETLNAVWFKMADEEYRVERVIRDTPDPTFQGGEVDPAREEMIRIHGIVRSHRRFTRACVDAVKYGDADSRLQTMAFVKSPEDDRANKAAVAFEQAIDSAHDDLVRRLYDLCHNSEREVENEPLEEACKAIVRNFTYAFHSARADLRKQIK